MRKIRFPVNCSNKIKNIICLALVIVLLAVSLSSVVLAAETPETEMSADIVMDTSGETEGTGIGQESIEETVSESEEKTTSIIYDQQPTTIEEVLTAIATYEAEYQVVHKTDGFEAAMGVQKPHWEHDIPSELIPKGYNCQLVDDDTEFGAEYYTFFMETVKLALGGDGSSGNPYLISSQSDLEELRTNVNNGNNYAGKYFALTQDIALSGTWIPIGTASTRCYQSELINYPYVYNGSPFSGTFDGYYNGQNHAITNLVTSGGNFQGLFGYLENATIKNLTVETGGSGVLGALHVGGLAAYASNSTIDNSRVNGTVKTTAAVTGSYYYVAGTGGLVGGSEKSTIRGCETNVSVTGGYNTGGLLGLALHGTTVTGCLAEGGITAKGHYVGGLVGHAYQDFTYYSRYTTVEKEINITNSSADVNIINDGDASNETGGLIGKVFIEAASSDGFKINIENCSATGSVTGNNNTSAYYGGLIGMAYAHSSSGLITIKNCHAKGNVTTKYYVVGGLIGYAQGNVTVDICSAKGDVNGSLDTAQDVGGLIGLTDGVNASWGGVIVKNSFATGEVYGGYYQIGGLIGEAYSCTKIENCYAAGNVTSNCTGVDWFHGVGGFIGSVTYAGTTIKNSYSIGRVVTIGSQQAGSFIGGVAATMTAGAYNSGSNNYLSIENCYATGTLTRTSGSGSTGGFIGRVPSNSRVSIMNSFFDTTMTGTSTAIGTVLGTVTGSPTALKTEEMIAGKEENVSSGKCITFNYQDKRAQAGDENNPWYIDEKITYPYLYYQFNNHAKTETNYNIKMAKWNNDIIIFDRTDFNNISGSGEFTVGNIGADRMYFPYAAGKNLFASNTAAITVPSFAFSSGNYSLYSLGSVSKTDIIAFINLPTAKKDSDRKDLDVPPDGVTDTYRGDTVRYDITITNDIPALDSGSQAEIDEYAYLYTWRNVTAVDPLAKGVTLIEGSIQISYDGGSTFITAGKGPSTADKNCYYYDPAEGENGNGTLYVYLNDLVPEGKAIVAFKVLAKKEAVGKSIRNKGTAEGIFKYDYHDPDKEYIYRTDFDDRNDDPVLGSCRVTYDGNSGKLSDKTTTEKYFIEPVKPDLTADHKVRDNIAADELGFTREDYEFIGWNTKDDGTGTEYIYTGAEKIGDTISITDDTKLYARWKRISGSVTIEKQGDEMKGLANAKFTLERLESDGTVTDTHAGVTDSNGELVFNKLPLGEYRITEVATPAGYSLLKEPLIVTVPYESTDTPSTTTPPDESYVDDITGNIVYVYYDLKYTITNMAAFELPKAGNTGILPNIFIIIGLVMITIAAGWYSYRKRCKGGIRS